MKHPKISRFHLIALTTLLAGATAASADGLGSLSWLNQQHAITNTRCALSGNDYIVRADAENLNLRIAFKGENGLGGVDFPAQPVLI